VICHLVEEKLAVKCVIITVKIYFH